MANPKKRVPENVPGDFFVDSTCIDCDACRQIAPAACEECIHRALRAGSSATPAAEKLKHNSGQMGRSTSDSGSTPNQSKPPALTVLEPVPVRR